MIARPTTSACANPEHPELPPAKRGRRDMRVIHPWMDRLARALASSRKRRAQAPTAARGLRGRLPV